MMYALKFFFDPISKLEPWLNRKAEQGYRLVWAKTSLFRFEPTAAPVRYAVQYLGGRDPEENAAYLRMLAEAGLRTFRVPVNQGSMAFGKIRFRPYARGTGKFANSFQDFNREILIVENPGETVQPLLTDPKDLARMYRDVRNTYAYGALVGGGFLCFALWRIPWDSERWRTYSVLIKALLLAAAGVLAFFVLLYAVLAWRAHRRMRTFEDDAQGRIEG